MNITRRGLLVAGFGAALGGTARAQEPQDDNVEDRALFWRIGMASGRRAIVFGAAPVAAAAAPEVVLDGYRFVPVTHRIVLGLAGPPAPWTAAPPVLPTLRSGLASRVRDALGAAGVVGAHRLNLSEIVAALAQEGAPAPAPSVADVLRDSALQINRPVTALLSAADMDDLARAAQGARPDAAAALERLLALRARVGPLGAYALKVYRGRSAGELLRAAGELDDIGRIGHVGFAPMAALADALWRALPTAIEADYDAYVFLPVSTLLGPDGLFARLTVDGAVVTPLA